jgi:rhodanese-related sulfurtransferase
VAEKYQADGFVNAKALRGGVDAWKQAGYGLMAAR